MGLRIRFAFLRRHRSFAFALIAAVALSGCKREIRTSGPMPQEIFVWQRVWTKNVERALAQPGDLASRLCVLAAEIDLRSSEPKIIRPIINYDALKANASSIALAIRIDPFAGRFGEDERTTQALLALVRDVIAEAQRHEANINELQIDFDCGESKIDGYRNWLRQIRAVASPLQVTPTALPSWLKHREFATLARECSGFILQVHSVSLPQRIEDVSASLTEPARAMQWAETAARIGVPFRVSLPTYSYLVAFDASGNACGISAEGPKPYWPREVRVRRWEAQPDKMQQLVAAWKRDRPQSLRGLCWYRLPIASDELNWSWQTLSAVMNGRIPVSAVRVAGSGPSQPTDVIAVNEGERDEPLPETVYVRWRGQRLLGADALDGYELQQANTPDTVVFKRKEEADALRLPPGRRRKIGWLRIEEPTATEISFAAVASPSPGLAH